LLLVANQIANAKMTIMTGTTTNGEVMLMRSILFVRVTKKGFVFEAPRLLTNPIIFGGVCFLIWI
jgi:hypothetical protein